MNLFTSAATSRKEITHAFENAASSRGGGVLVLAYADIIRRCGRRRRRCFLFLDFAAGSFYDKHFEFIFFMCIKGFYR